MAGEPTRATARTRRTRTEQLQRSAEASDRGAEDEESTARVLGALSSDGWHVFHDVRWPGREHANIDHVLVGPGGVFVVDSKSWTGTIEVRGGALRLDGRRRTRHVIAAAAAAMAIGELLPGVEPGVIHPVLCFARTEPIFGWSGDTMICSSANVGTFVASRPRSLGATQVSEIAEVLATSLQVAPAPVPAALATYGRGTPAQAAHDPSARQARGPRTGVPRRVRLVAKLLAVAVAGALAVQFDLPARVSDVASGAVHFVLAPTRPIGTAYAVPGLGSRPSLEVTARSPVVTSSTVPGVEPARGHQLVAVPVEVRNTGQKSWISQRSLDAVLTDATGATYSSDPAYTSVRAGKTLGPALMLTSGTSTRGLVVFEVPRGTRVADVQLRVGPSLPATLRWSVG